MELSTYFRINAAKTGQFERTLIIADEGSYVSYLEGCTAPMRDENQLHAAVVELVAHEDATIKYSTSKIGIPVIQKQARAVFIISLPNGERVWKKIQKYPGPKWKPVRQLRGSIHLVF